MLLCCLCAINVILDTMSMNFLNHCLYSLITIIIALGLYFLRTKKIKYISPLISLSMFGLLCYSLYNVIIKIDLTETEFDFIQFFLNLDVTLIMMFIGVCGYYIISGFVSMITKKSSGFGLISVLILIGVQYAYSNIRSTYLIIALGIVVLTYYLLISVRENKYRHYNVLQLVSIIVIVILLLVPSILIPYDSYVERPLSDYFMSQYAKDVQARYDQENGLPGEGDGNFTGGSGDGEGNGAGDLSGEGEDLQNEEQEEQDKQEMTSQQKPGGGGSGGTTGESGANADLNSAGNIKYDSANVALQVISDSGPISTYLRGSSAAIYNDGKWDMLSSTQAAQISKLQPSSYFVQNQARALASKRVSLTINEISVTSAYKYVPYYDYEDAPLNFDSYITGENSYTFNDVKVGVMSSALLTSGGSNTDSKYDEFADKYYKDVPNDLKKKLDTYLKEYGYNSSISINDRVTLVKKLLASQCVYSLKPGDCPKDKDPIEYFIFENKKGYCMHFAASAALMLRTMDIPTRYCSGFMLNSTDFKGNEALVTNAQAHAWVEAYVKGVGWIPVEATPASGGGGGEGQGAGEPPMTEPELGKSEDTPQGEQPEPSIDSNQETTAPEKQPQQEEPKKEEQNQDKKKEDTVVSEETDYTIFIVVGSVILVIGLIIGLLYLRRERIIKRRNEEFNQENHNKRYIAYYDYLTNLEKYHQEINNNFEDIALKAAYSRIEISDEEINLIVNYTNQSVSLIIKDASKIKLLVYQYIFVIV